MDSVHTGTQITELHAIVDGLIYASYRANRLRSPEVLPERWSMLPCFHDFEELEARFQREVAQA